MATPTCIKCGNTTFEVANFTPTNSRYVLLSVHCSTCGGIAGVLDAQNIGHMLETLTDVTKELVRAS
jgi:predicted nucleic-acid-binding Zn-ribbon protein